MILLDRIASLLLSIALSSLALFTLHQSILLLQTSKKNYFLTEQKSHILQLLQNIKNDLDSHPLRMLYRLQGSHNLSWHSGTANTIATRKDQLRPRDNSDILSLLQLDLEQRLEILSAKIEPSNILQINACTTANNPIQLIYKSYLGINLDQMHELVTQEFSRLTENCISLRVRPEEGMFNGKTDPGLYNLLIPIQSNYSIYQDNQNRLRKVTHLASKNTSNQVIIPLTFALRIKLEEDPSSHLLKLQLILDSASKSSIFETLGMIPRSSLATYLLIQTATFD